MDPVTFTIVSSIAMGAAAGLKSVTAQAVKDAYAGIKTLIQQKYATVNLMQLENNPESEIQQAAVGESLVDAGANIDQELLDLAHTLAETIKQYEPCAAVAIGIDLEDVEAQYLNAKKIVAQGTGLKARNVKLTGGIDIGEIRAGNVNDSSKKE